MTAYTAHTATRKGARKCIAHIVLLTQTSRKTRRAFSSVFCPSQLGSS
ncbi:hypothetical protein YPPY54_4426, partial [Yersinia pestis PY-54]